MGHRIKFMLDEWNRKYVPSDSTFELCAEISRLTLVRIISHDTLKGTYRITLAFLLLENTLMPLRTLNMLSLIQLLSVSGVAISMNTHWYYNREMQSRAEQLYPVYHYYPSWLAVNFNKSVQRIRSIALEKITKRRSQNTSNDIKYLLDTMLEAQSVIIILLRYLCWYCYYRVVVWLTKRFWMKW